MRPDDARCGAFKESGSCEVSPFDGSASWDYDPVSFNETIVHKTRLIG
jgi:hypothetical protein